MKIVNNAKKNINAVRTSNIPTGTVFSGKIGHTTSIFLKVYLAVVDLNEPGNTYDAHSNGSFDPSFSDYQELDATLTVTSKGTR